MMTMLESLARALRGETVIALRVEIHGMRRGERIVHRVPGNEREPLLRSLLVHDDSDHCDWEGFQHDPVPGFDGPASVVVKAWTATSVIRSTAVDGIWGWRSLPLKPESGDMASTDLARNIKATLDGVDAESLPALEG